jgi:transcriptional regulator with XRE-family HTH domain
MFFTSMKRHVSLRMPILTAVGGAIQDRRRSHGMSQEDLAELSGLHRNTLGRIERGECDTSIVALSYLYFLLGSAGVMVDRGGVFPFSAEGVSYAAAPGVTDMHPATMIRLLAVAIRGRRGEMRLSLQRLADLSNVHLNSLWSFERGLVVPTITTYHGLLRALEVSAVTQNAGTPTFK